MFCKNCGKEAGESAIACTGCGGAVNDNLKAPEKVIAPKKPIGRGIAAMVLGIMGLMWAIIMLIGTPEALRDLDPNADVAFSMGYYTGLVMIQSVFAIVAVSLAASERMKSKNGFNIAGLWLSIATFALIAITVVMIAAH